LWTSESKFHGYPSEYFRYIIPFAIRHEFSTTTSLHALVDWLRWGETDVSELRPLQAYCSSPGDCDVDHGMMVSTGAYSQLVYQSALAAPSTARRSCYPKHLWSEWESGRRREGNENLVSSYPCNLKIFLTCHKILRHGTSGFTSHPRGRCAADFYRL
jgi:hypothetical protein